MTKPTHGQANWDVTLNDHLDSLDVTNSASAASTALSATYDPLVKANSVVYYVSKSGSDSNSGLTRGKALLTIGAAMTAMTTAGGVIHVGPGIFTEEFKLKSRVRILGAGKAATTIQAVTSSANLGVVTIDPTAPCQSASLEDLTIAANGNAGQSGIYLQGTAVSAPGSGLWNSKFKNIKVSGFALHQIWLRGGGTNSLNPNQFLIFENCEAYAGTAGYALFMSGQVGQVSVINGNYDGPGIGTGLSNIRLNRECSDTLGATIASDKAPYAISFTNVSTQGAAKGVYIDRANPVTFYGGHLENLWYGIDCINTASLTVVDGVNFANTGVDGSAGGYCVQAGASSYTIARNNVVQGAVDKSFKVAAGSSGVLVTSGNSEVGNGYRGSGLTAQISAAAILTLGQGKTFIVNTGATQITTLNSDLGPGEQLFLKAHAGTIVFATGGNITMGGRASPVTLAQDAVACFVRIDLGGAWMLVSTT